MPRHLRTHLPPAVIALALALALSAVPARGFERFRIQQDIVFDTREADPRPDEYLDTTLQVAWKRAHAALTFGSFDAGMELGGYRLDRRGSAYALTLRRRTAGRVENSSLEFESLQKFGRALVTGGLKGFWPDHPTGQPLLLVPTLGADLYLADESFVSLRIIADPRPGTGIVARLACRLGDARRRLDAGLTPRTDGACGWSLSGRYDVFVAGFGAEPDFDFTGIDRQIYFIGFEYDLRP